ncbi:MAG: SIS domain-containing protein [Candidatus Parvarchaeota archaeon]|nr:SIS domain-containing protein [Candidatus Jingweiarchaeum tengchongense]MCW1297676.1 SIS domain-containing protein [Candidatus Jingweiarchaeum tengchongense]MCW1299687.1 SIS domain-containing protein [Candidatus Jingweiarchaeum tengchongense]MCW1304345.1 SIS domain-containing protein [Candidatus Jingweiarchaeum tengchongense]MCW1305672.1 SIS domain-containing protein [Candidatus Jingweiarchaeum tengchongense]
MNMTLDDKLSEKIKIFDYFNDSFQFACERLKMNQISGPIDEVKSHLRKVKDEKKPIWFVGVGRSGLVGVILSAYARINGFNSGWITEESTLSPEFNKDHTLLLITGTGTTPETVGYASEAREAGSKLICFTSYPQQKIGELSDYKIHIPGRTKIDERDLDTRQLINNPLDILGSEFEHSALLTGLCLIDILNSDKNINQRKSEFIDYIKNIKLDSNQFLKRALRIHKTKENNKKIVTVGVGMSNVVAKFYAKRLAHCAKKDDDIHVYHKSDAGLSTIKKDDLIEIISGSGRKYWAEKIDLIHSSGANINLITSYKTSLAAMKLNANDLLIQIPGRIIEREKELGETAVPSSLEKLVFEIRTLIADDVFIHYFLNLEGITHKEVQDRHPIFT